MADSSTTSTNLPSQQPAGKSANRLVDSKIGSSKHSNVIHRTTSESLRLAGNEHLSGTGCNTTVLQPPPSTLINANSTQSSRKTKNSSFQITSVTVGTRMSADNGDDSADDLDESHTDDNSRITDLENETPSFSEDTFSKEDVFFSSSGIGSAPVIPTSSQYGLAIVAPDLGGSCGQSLSDVHVSVTDAGINIVGGSNKHDVDLKDMHNRNERFKVVKIESTEPFKRGRWMCMDYLDHTTLQPVNTHTGTTKDGTADSGIVINENNIEQDNPSGDSPNKTVQTEINVQSIINASLLAGQSAPGGGYPVSASTSPGQTMHQPLPNASDIISNVTSHAQTMSHVPIQVNIPNITAPAQSLPPQQLQQVLLQASNQQAATNYTENANITMGDIQQQQQQQAQPQTQPQSQTQPQTQPQQHNNIQGQSQPAQFYAAVNQQNPSHIQHGQTLPAGTLQAIVQPAVVSSQVPIISNQAQAISIGQNVQQQQPPQQLPQSQTSDQNIVPSQQQTVSQPSFPQIQSPPNPVGQPQSQPIIPTNLDASTNFTPIAQPTSIPVSIASQLSAQSIVTENQPQQQPQQPQQQQQQQQQQSSTTTPGTQFVLSTSGPQNFNSQVFSVSGTPVANSSVSSVSASNTPVSNIAASGGGGGSSGIGNIIVNVDTESVSQQQQQQQQQQSSTATTAGTAVSGGNVAVSLGEQLSVQQISASTTASATTESTDGSVTATGTATASGGDETQTTEESESFAGFALALTGKPQSSRSVYVSPRPKKSDTHNSIESNPCHFIYNPSRRESKVFTNLALGNYMEESTDQVLSNVNVNTIFDKQNGNGQPYANRNIQNLIREESIGIPIPKVKHRSQDFNNLNVGGSSVSSSPINMVYGSPGSSPYSGSLDVYYGSRNTSRAASPQNLSSSVGTNNGDYSASGTSAVAIDNKIEQAMDLVKSHLMFAVREEVEVLKEKIAELMDRINQLEVENTILKANASQETLTQLMTIAPVKPPQNPNNPTNGPIS